MLVDCVRVEEEWWMIWKEINMGLSARFNLSYISVFAYVFVSVLVFVFMSIFIFVFWLYSYLRWWSIQRWSIWVGAQFNPSYIFLTSLLQTGPWGKCRRPWQMRLPYESREKWKNQAKYTYTCITQIQISNAQMLTALANEATLREKRKMKNQPRE